MTGVCFFQFLEVLPNAVDLLVDLSTVVVAPLTTARHLQWILDGIKKQNTRRNTHDWLVVSTPLKHMSQNGKSSPNRAAQKKYLKPPPRFSTEKKKQHQMFFCLHLLAFFLGGQQKSSKMLSIQRGRILGLDAMSQCRPPFEGLDESCVPNG